MLRVLLRAGGFTLVAMTFAALVVDGTRTVAARHIMLYSVAEALNWLVPNHLADLTGLAERSPPLVHALIEGILQLSASLFTGIAAASLLLCGRDPSAWPEED